MKTARVFSFLFVLFAALVLDSFAIAAQALVGAALGGSRPDEARHTSWRVARMGLWAGLGIIYFVSLLSLPSDGWRLTGLSSSDTKPFVYDLHLTGEPTPLRSGDALASTSTSRGNTNP